MPHDYEMRGMHIKIAELTAKNSTLDKGVEEKIKKKRLVILNLFLKILYI